MIVFAFLSGLFFADPATVSVDGKPATFLNSACIEQMDSSAAMGGGWSYRSGIHFCFFRLSDPAHGAGDVTLAMEFRKYRYAPTDPDLEDLRRTKGTYLRASLTIAGEFYSSYEPRFEGEAQFILMPRWENLKAQSDALPGADWPIALDKPRVRCEPNSTRCRVMLLARYSQSLVVLALFDRRPDEPLETTAEALRQLTAGW